MVAASRVLLARPLRRGSRICQIGQGGRPSAPGLAGGQKSRVRLGSAGRRPRMGDAGMEREVRRASRGGYLVFDAIECKCENSKVSCV
jgi:hypothetical protein